MGKHPQNGINSTDDSREGIEKYLKRNPTTSFIAVEDGKTVGAVLAGHDGRRGFIQHMTVLAEYRHRGIATKLPESAMTALEKRGDTEGRAADVHEERPRKRLLGKERLHNKGRRLLPQQEYQRIGVPQQSVYDILLISAYQRK